MIYLEQKKEKKNIGVGSHSLLQGIEPKSPTLQADSLPSEPPRKPIWLLKETGSSHFNYKWSYQPCIIFSPTIDTVLLLVSTLANSTCVCSVQFTSVAQSCPTLHDPMDCSTLGCPSPTPRACPNSCSSSQWCHPTISSSVIPFSSCLQYFPASRSFPMSQFFTSGG